MGRGMEDKDSNPKIEAEEQNKGSNEKMEGDGKEGARRQKWRYPGWRRENNEGCCTKE